MIIRTFQSYSDPWPAAVVDMTELISPFHSPAGVFEELERGRSAELQREARERRSSMRRFGSPDVYPRLPNATHSAPNDLGLEHHGLDAPGVLEEVTRRLAEPKVSHTGAGGAPESIPMTNLPFPTTTAPLSTSDFFRPGHHQPSNGNQPSRGSPLKEHSRPLETSSDDGIYSNVF